VGIGVVFEFIDFGEDGVSIGIEDACKFLGAIADCTSEEEGVWRSGAFFEEAREFIEAEVLALNRGLQQGERGFEYRQKCERGSGEDLELCGQGDAF
jgi:hypothetical protein